MTRTDPRVIRSRAAALAAATELLAERGVAGTTVEAVAARSGVAKTTVYRQWADQHALVLDAVDAMLPTPAPPDTGTLRDDLLAVVEGLRRGLCEGPAAAVMAALIDAAERDPAFAALHHREADRRHQVVHDVLRRANERGEIGADVDADELLDTLAGPLVHRRYVTGRPLDERVAAHAVDLAIAGLPRPTHRPVELTTPRLVLRPFRPSDAPALHDYLSRPDAVEFEPYDPVGPQECERLAAERAQDERFLAVCLASGRLIGNLFVAVDGPPAWHTWTIGYVMHPDHWGHGYATEAVTALLGDLFGRRDAHRVVARCDPRNTRSWRLLERVGMRREAHLLQAASFADDADGRPIWHDVYQYALLSDEAELAAGQPLDPRARP